ncbi:hypothetical protein VTN31DRAFT_599 [Thermomyces dupontii]|uniref:uncharacterized protein n=1 Tax=Talaromyces thermophilus TaxID=28565 RepID=UPI003743BADB
MQVPLIRLQCGVNSYDWGKVGQQSAAAKYAAATASDFAIEEEKPYAELWMGTHPSLPSKDIVTQRTLLDLVQDNQALLGREIAERYDSKLPFLFKVLSIRKALSIQAHPNKKLAEQLHAQDPQNYPDSNHKPEMTIAITPFEGLCGFRPLKEIVHFLKTVPPLRSLVGEQAAQQFEEAVRGKEESEDAETVTRNKEALRTVFTALMESPADRVVAAAQDLVAEAERNPANFAGGVKPNASDEQIEGEGEAQSHGASSMAELVVRLNGQFPNDIGLFVLFFLNYVTLSPGEGMFLKADDIHAYISGDIIECMASSDNVVRAGFTPKFKDVSTLTRMLTYSYAPISEQKMTPTEYPYATLNMPAYISGSAALLYNPPIEEFAVVKTDLNKKGAKVTFDPVPGPSIIICTSGDKGTISVGPAKTEEIRSGHVFFVGADAECVIENQADEPLVTFKAFCELEPPANDGEGLPNGS